MYNSVHYDDTEMSTLCDGNVNDIHVHCIANPSKHNHTHCITVEQVKFAINKLNQENLIVQMVYYLIILKMAHIFYTAILHYYLPVC